ncbi:MAG: LpxD N-terminal domain-containing protein, partial [Planctomycetota bacterium JB042]
MAGEVGGTVVGDGSVRITGLAGLKDARAGDLSFVAGPEFLRFVETTRASALLVGDEFPIEFDRPRIRVEDPAAAMERLVPSFRVDESLPRGVDPRASVADVASIGGDVTIGPGATGARGASVG